MLAHAFVGLLIDMRGGWSSLDSGGEVDRMRRAKSSKRILYCIGVAGCLALRTLGLG